MSTEDVPKVGDSQDDSTRMTNDNEDKSINDNPQSNEVNDKAGEKSKKNCENCGKEFDKSYVKKHMKYHCPAVKKAVGNEKNGEGEIILTETVDISDNDVINDVDQDEEILGIASELSSQESVVTSAAEVLDEMLKVATSEQTPAKITDAVINVDKESCKECETKDNENQQIRLERLRDINDEGNDLRKTIAEKNVELEEKETKIVEQSGTIVGLLNKMRHHAKEKQGMAKKIKEIVRLKKIVADKEKNITHLMIAVQTKDALMKIKESQEKQTEKSSQEIVIEAEVVKCKTENCNFEAVNKNVMINHIENYHKCTVFECPHCDKKFRFKNKMKLHIKQTHETNFACFACNTTFQAYKDLQKHIQRRCKTGDNTSKSKNTVTPSVTTTTSTITPNHHTTQRPMSGPSTFKCPRCSKELINQKTLVEHINQVHTARIDNKCEVCNKECNNKDELVKHIDKYHTQSIIERHICSRCNVEVHGGSNKESHRCRPPQWNCHFCKV